MSRPLEEVGINWVEARRLLAMRDDARKRGDFDSADALREKLRKCGYTIKDRPGGSSLVREKP